MPVHAIDANEQPIVAANPKIVLFMS
jgi:hypothetical protein